MRFGSLVTVMDPSSASSNALSAGRCVCSVSLPSRRAASIFRRYAARCSLMVVAGSLQESSTDFAPPVKLLEMRARASDPGGAKCGGRQAAGWKPKAPEGQEKAKCTPFARGLHRGCPLFHLLLSSCIALIHLLFLPWSRGRDWAGEQGRRTPYPYPVRLRLDALHPGFVSSRRPRIVTILCRQRRGQEQNWGCCWSFSHVAGERRAWR